MAAPTPTFGAAEQDVIEALFSQEVVAKMSKKQIIKETASVRELHGSRDSDKFADALRQEARDYDVAFKEALDDFIKRNKTDVKIVFSTNAPKSVELVSDAALKQIFSTALTDKPNGWDLFYQRFPDSRGLFTISRVGIDTKGTIAIVYLGKLSSYVIGSGRIHVLRREGNRWVLPYDHDHFGPSWRS